MIRTLSIAATTGLVSGMLIGGTVVPSQAASKTITACVKKSDGTVKVLTGKKKNKKCKKGWKKTTWNKQGPAGPSGPAGPNWSVTDKNGQVLGDFGGLFQVGLRSAVVVLLSDGGAVRYFTDGALGRDNGGIYFENNGCTDAAVLGASSASLQEVLKSAGSTARGVWLQDDNSVVRAYKVATTTTTTVPVAANSLFRKDSTTGACAAATHLGGFIVELTEAEKPLIAAGPINIVR